jgi:hypothetical protein
MMDKHAPCNAVFGLISARADYFAVSTELPTQSWSLWTCHRRKYSKLSQEMMCRHATCKAVFGLLGVLIIALQLAFKSIQYPQATTTEFI